MEATATVYQQKYTTLLLNNEMNHPANWHCERTNLAGNYFTYSSVQFFLLCIIGCYGAASTVGIVQYLFSSPYLGGIQI